MSDLINRYYETYDEETRLSRDNLHQIEYRTTMRFLEKYISPCSAILDSCAGTGIYAFSLAARGHRVTAGDIVPRHVGRMREKDAGSQLQEIYEGDAADLSRFGNGAFDAVLCLGALYHLRGDVAERAVAEGARVLKQGGIFAFSYINPTGVYFAQLMRAIRKEKHDGADRGLSAAGPDCGRARGRPVPRNDHGRGDRAGCAARHHSSGCRLRLSCILSFL